MQKRKIMNEIPEQKYIEIGHCNVNFVLVQKYVLHCFEPTDPLEVWEYMRSELHNQIRKSCAEFDKIEELELSSILDRAISCPICNKVPIFQPRDYCKACVRTIMPSDVESRLLEIYSEQNNSLPLDQEYLAAGYVWGP